MSESLLRFDHRLLSSIRHCRDEMELRATLLSAIQSLGGRDYLYISVVSEDEPHKGAPGVFIWSGNLIAFCRRYVRAQHYLRDPALIHGRLSNLPLSLSSLSTMSRQSTLAFLADLDRFGLTYGVALPIHGGLHDPLDMLVVYPESDSSDGERQLLARDSAVRALGHETKAWLRRDARNAILSRADISQQDIQVLQLVYRGFTRNDIANHLNVPASRIKTISQRLSAQFEQRTVEAAARVAVQVGLVRLLG